MNWFRPYCLVIGVLFLTLALLLAFSGSWLLARKVIALWLMPTGLVWIALIAAIFWPRVKKWHRIFLAGLCLLYTLAGNPLLGVALLRPLEEPYLAHEEVDPALDALIVLGGGSGSSPAGNPAVGTHGDRLLKPATLFYEGKVKHLITTGRSVTEKGADRLLSEETSRIWQGLSIPKEAIIEISEPRNTSEEMAAIAKLLEDHPDWERVGLCSSASHLNRAFGEARTQGLKFIPVPSDFRSQPLPFIPLYLVPQARGFRDVQTACWEFLGGLF